MIPNVLTVIFVVRISERKFFHNLNYFCLQAGLSGDRRGRYLRHGIEEGNSIFYTNIKSHPQFNHKTFSVTCDVPLFGISELL